MSSNLYATAVIVSVLFGIRFLISYQGDPDTLSKPTNYVSWARSSVDLALISGWFARPDPGRPTSFVIPAILFALAVSYMVVYLARNGRARREAAKENPPATAPEEPGPEGDDGQH